MDSMETPEWVRRDETVAGTLRSQSKSRNQRACDGCRSRKVKCLFSPSDTRCTGCAFLEIECTHERPRRKRGPPNKTQLRAGERRVVTQPSPRRVEDNASSPARSRPAVSTTTVLLPAPAAGNASSCAPKGVLDILAPRSVINNVLDSWFDEVHALAPVLCRHHFFRRLAADETDYNRVFAGLVISLCAATVATLRRETHGGITIEACRDIIQEHQLLAVSLSDCQYTVDWCIAMYNMSTSLLTFPHNRQNDMAGFHAWSSTAAGVRYMTYYCLQELSIMEQEQLKRLYWLVFVAAMSGDCVGKLMPTFISHQDNLELLQPLPLTDDDLDATTTSPESVPSAYSPAVTGVVSSWHGDHTSYVPGLISLTKLYRIWRDVQITPSARLGGPDIALLYYQEQIHQVIDTLPRELRWRGGLSKPPWVTQGHESQTANIFITSLHLRSNLLQKQGQHTTRNAAEHQMIIDDLLEILYHMAPPVLHANGVSIIPKVRDIGAAYLEEMTQASVEHAPDILDRMNRLARKLCEIDCWPDITQAAALLRAASDGALGGT